MVRLLSDTLGFFVTFFVPAVVWGTLAAGVYQLVCEELCQIRGTLQKSHRLERYVQQTG
ncbi:MAG: hypothetical protein SXV54_17465 [Chloroflexota bacterium]|nr:hypothetical protein [Chloroflexota bacterium]